MKKVKRNKNQSKAVKNQLFISCGRIDLYSMEVVAKRKLQLHHYPKFEHSHQTVFEESYLIEEQAHHDLHLLEIRDPYRYYLENERLYYNKQKILELNQHGKF